MRWIGTVYEHREKKLPFLAVIFSGVRNQKIEFCVPAKTRQDAETFLKERWEEMSSGKSPRRGLR
jgi:hypothetical protein